MIDVRNTSMLSILGIQQHGFPQYFSDATGIRVVNGNHKRKDNESWDTACQYPFNYHKPSWFLSSHPKNAKKWGRDSEIAFSFIFKVLLNY